MGRGGVYSLRSVYTLPINAAAHHTHSLLLLDFATNCLVIANCDNTHTRKSPPITREARMRDRDGEEGKGERVRGHSDTHNNTSPRGGGARRCLL